MSKTATAERPAKAVKEAKPRVLGISFQNAQGQELYEKIQRQKQELSSARHGRKTLLMESPRYAEIVDEISKLTESLKARVKTFDRENPDVQTEIDALKEGIDLEMRTLISLSLQAMKQGKPFTLFRTLRNGKQRKIELQYSAKFKQASLF